MGWVQLRWEQKWHLIHISKTYGKEYLMELFGKKGKKFIAVLCTACLLSAGLPSVSPSAAAETPAESGVVQTVYNGFTYSYRELKKYPGAIEIVGVKVPEGETVLAIPETLDGKSVISLDLDEFEGVSPPQYSVPAEDAVTKLILPRTMRPLKETSGDIKLERICGVFQYLESIEVQSGSRYLKTKDHILYSKDGSRLICYPPQKKSEKYKMPSSVTASCAYFRNNYVKEIVFSDNPKYKTIKSWHFPHCDNLQSIYLPDNITKIGSYVFDGCSSLKTIRWSKNLKTIGESAFKNCNSLSKIKLPGKVRIIGNDAFRWCYSKVVILPESVAVVGWRAFGTSKGSTKSTEIKKPSYLLSSNQLSSKKIKKYYPYASAKYTAVLTAVKKGKKAYYPSYNVSGLIPTKREISLHVGESKKASVIPEILDPEEDNVKKGWIVKTDILTFRSSNAKIAKVTASGRIKGRKKGSAVITIAMKTGDAKCKVKVKVK